MGDKNSSNLYRKYKCLLFDESQLLVLVKLSIISVMIPFTLHMYSNGSVRRRRDGTHRLLSFSIISMPKAE